MCYPQQLQMSMSGGCQSHLVSVPRWLVGGKGQAMSYKIGLGGCLLMDTIPKTVKWLQWKERADRLFYNGTAYNYIGLQNMGVGL